MKYLQNIEYTRIHVSRSYERKDFVRIDLHKKLKPEFF